MATKKATKKISSAEDVSEVKKTSRATAKTKQINVSVMGETKKSKTEKSKKSKAATKPQEVEDIFEDYEPDDDVILKPGTSKKSVVAAIKEANKKETIKKEKVKSPFNIYKKIAITFVALTVILLGVIFYFSYAHVDIVLIPSEERVSGSVSMTVYDKDKNTNQTSMEEEDKIPNGVIQEMDIEASKNYQPSQTETIGGEVTGKVTIYNNYTKNQPLMASTRLMSSDGKLFRLKDTVSVSPGSSVEVAVYADKPGADMALAPSKFTLPGLWAGIQDKIYAESKEAFVYQEQVKRTITQDDIDNAIKDIKNVLIEKVKTDVSEKYKDYTEVKYEINEKSISQVVGGKVGETKDGFSVSMKAKVVIIAFNADKVVALAQKKLASQVPVDKDLTAFNANTLIYNLNGYSLKDGTADISISYEGKMLPKDNSSLIEKERLIGMSKEEVESYLSSLPEIASFRVRFYPPFVRKVPNLVDRIKVEVKK